MLRAPEQQPRRRRSRRWYRTAAVAPELAGDAADRRRDDVGGDALLLDAWSGSADVDAVVTAFVLAATRASVSAGSIGRTEPLGDG
jgi:hypothetical protein